MKVDGDDNNARTPPMVKLKGADCDGEHENDEIHANGQCEDKDEEEEKKRERAVVIKEGWDWWGDDKVEYFNQNPLMVLTDHHQFDLQ